MCATLAGGIGGARAQAQAPPGWKAVVRIRPNPIPLGRCTNIEIEMQDPDGFRTGLLSNGQQMNQRKFLFTSSDNTSFSWRGDPTDGIICAVAGAPPATTTIRVAFPDGLIGEVQLTSVAPGTSVTPMTYAPQARLRPPGFVSRAPVAVAAAMPGASAPAKPAIAAAPTAPAAAVGTAPPPLVTRAATGVAVTPPSDANPAILPTSHSIAAPAKISPASAKAFVPGTVAVTSPQIAAVGPYFTPSSVAITAPTIQAVGAVFTPTGIAVSAPALIGVGSYFTPSPAIVTEPIIAIGPTP